ncbi:hypothetical protein SNE25_15300 [Mucilaginibacter sabulilitoris]|uniref:Uncharacterized protein n=1 Tax=Mucilaginibacter sabulilitoris TaxID=1173583 RepID=A0ABZ0TUX7_9SPHI|nr:hypothetical protein [Mucilaginibacter sabulilitoris]WPU96886.1 hypothetical protein SNE25_15300 [Mucilaginibacter sabulilitoris]
MEAAGSNPAIPTKAIPIEVKNPQISVICGFFVLFTTKNHQSISKKDLLTQLLTSSGQYKFKGSEIDRSLSYGKLNKQIGQQVRQKEAEEQRPSLAQQLREVINKEPDKEQSHHQPIFNPFEHLPVITPEPDEPYRRRKRKGQDQDQSQGISY